jgi:alkylation response protein AidB-like acyl-CoA dehydrogenase
VPKFSPELEMLRDTVRHIANEVIAPRAAEIDLTCEFPWDIKKLLQRQGLFSVAFPPALGGCEQSHTATCLTIEEIARACVSSSLILQVQALGATPILLAGTEAQQRKYCAPLASGEKLIAFGLTEPGAGSDSAAMATTAELRGDGYVLNGLKHFISNATVADLFTIFAMTDRSKGIKGISAFIVEKDFPGFRIGRVEQKMGIHGSPTAELIFEECRVPRENLLGREGEGFKIAMKSLDPARVTVAAQAVGIAQAALSFAVKYAKERIQFGGPIAQLQGIQFMLADMAAQVEAARALTYHAAALADEDSPQLSYFAAAAKLTASDVAMRVTTDSVQIAGGYGYLVDFPAERYMRDAKITQIYEGTNQIQRLVIARHLLK